MPNWNDNIIKEFREHEGKVGGGFEGRPLLLLHHRGARSGTERVNPLAYQDLGDGAVAVFGSKGGADSNPDWYHNLIANPHLDPAEAADARLRRLRAKDQAPDPGDRPGAGGRPFREPLCLTPVWKPATDPSVSFPHP